MSEAVRAEVSERIRSHLEDFLAVPQHLNRFNATTLGRGNLDATSVPSLTHHFLAQVEIFETVTSLYFGNADGGLIGVGREGAGGALYTLKTTPFAAGRFSKTRVDTSGAPVRTLVTLPDFDARTRPWYRAAVARATGAWSDVYILFTGDGMAIAPTWPVTDDRGRLIGVVAADIFLSHICSYLKDLHKELPGQTFIIDDDGLLVASSHDTALFTLAAEGAVGRRLAARDSDEPVIREIGRRLADHPTWTAGPDGIAHTTVELAGTSHFLDIVPFRDPFGLSWRIVTATPADAHLGVVHDHNRLTLWLIVLALTFAGGVAIGLARWIADPIRQLQVSAAELAAGDFSRRLDIRHADEVNRLAQSFNRMASQLQVSFERQQNQLEELTASQEALAESEARLNTVIDTAPVGILVADADGAVLTANRAAEEILAAPKPALTALAIEDLVPDRVRGDHRRWREGVIASGDARATTVRCVVARRRDGEEFPVEVGVAVVAFADRPHLIVCLSDITERNRLQAELRAREGIFLAIANQAFDAIALIDRESLRFVEFNEAAHANLGYDRDHFARLTLAAIDAAADPAVTEAAVARAVADGGGVFETRHRRIDGEPRDVRISMRLIEVRDRPCLAAIWSDITEQKRTARQLAASEAALNAAQAVAKTGSWSFDIAADRLTWSRETYRLFGVPEGTPVSFDFFLALVHPDDRDQVRAAWQAALTGAPYLIDHRIVVGGAVWYVREAATISRDRDGRPVHTIGTVQDITERTEAEEKIRDLAERMQLATEAAGIGIWDYDIATDRLEWSDQMFAIYGISPEQYAGTREAWLARVHPDDRPAVEEAYRAALTDDSRIRIEFRVHRPDHSIRAISSRGKVDRAPDGTAIRMIGTNWDITDYRAALKAAETAKEQAEKANAAKSRFLATMSHELRTPLNAILGFSNILANSEADPTRRDQLNVITEAGNSLLNLIQDILDLSRIESGKVTVVAERFELARELASVFQLFRVQAGRKGLALAHELAPSLPPVLVGDCGLLRQVLINLVSNAIKFTDRGSVTVSVAGTPKGADRLELRFAVTDTGIGILPENQERIFRIFEQEEEGALTRRYGGSGLGLAIAKDIVKLLGGEIWVSSTPGAGSCFSFTAVFARGVAPAAPARPSGAIDRPPRTAVADPPPRASILVAEDDASNRKLIDHILTSAGYSVAFAEDGAEALAASARQRFDLMLMDIQMPVINGVEVTRQIRAGAVAGCDPRVPIIAVTAHALIGDGERFRAQGLTDYVSKPISTADLLAKITAALPASVH